MNGCARCGARSGPTGRGLELSTGQACDVEPGDFHVCFGCGDVLIYAPAGSGLFRDGVDGWRTATPAEIFATTPAARKTIAALSREVRRVTCCRLPGVGGMVN